MYSKPLELCIGGDAQKTKNDAALRRSKKFSDVFTHLDTITAFYRRTDRQTDRRTDMVKQYRILHADSSYNNIYALSKSF